MLSYKEFERRTELINNEICETCNDIYEDKFACDHCKKVKNIDDEYDSYGDIEYHRGADA